MCSSLCCYLHRQSHTPVTGLVPRPSAKDVSSDMRAMPYTDRCHVFKSGNTSNISILHHFTSSGHRFFFLLELFGELFFFSRLRYEICQQNYNYVSLKISTEVFSFLFNLQGFHPSSLTDRLDEWRANLRTQSSRMIN